METKEMEVGPYNVDTYKKKKSLTIGRFDGAKEENSNTPHNVCNASNKKPIDVNVMRTDHTISGSLY